MMRISRHFVLLCSLTAVLFFFGCFPGAADPRYIDYRRTSEDGADAGSHSVPADTIKQAAALDFNEAEGDIGVEPADSEVEPASAPRNYSLSSSTLSWRLAEELLPFLHAPYKYGGDDTTGVDCSGLTMAVYESAFALKLPHKAALQFRKGKRVKRRQLMAGDLVFFYQKNRPHIGHVGLYLADDQFIHSVGNKGVVISDLSSPYWQKIYAGARRYLLVGDE
ncbi:MAG: C40 family peptidase [Deferribacteres bacterium]|nr:C40 family peptidase [candidate division KSB1 bacterium]MCB9508677.1 C40 family peptidase [Deferribacteres bacterium]